MRAFLAVALTGEVQQRLSDLQGRLRDQIERQADTARISWVRPDTMHLTLAFFADLNPALVVRLHDAAAARLASLRPARLPLARFGAFPTPREPRVIWVGPPDGWDRSADGLAVRDLDSAVRSACASLGIEHDGKPLQPHLTLGRVRSRERQVGRALSSMDLDRPLDAGVVDIRVVTLFESELTSGGPTHTERWAVSVSGPPRAEA